MAQTIKIFFVFLWLKIQEITSVVCKTSFCVLAGALVVATLSISIGAMVLGTAYFFSPDLTEEFIRARNISLNFVQGWFLSCLIVGGTILGSLGVLTILYLSVKNSWRRVSIGITDSWRKAYRIVVRR